MKEKQVRNKRKEKLKAFGMGLALLLGMAAGCLGCFEEKIEVMAAGENIKVSELSVYAKDDGICAGCVYQNLDSSIYTVQIYLEKKSGAETIPVVYRDLPDADEEQRLETETCREGAGIYRAVLLIRFGGEMTVVRFQDSGWYEAVDMGDHYEVRPYVPDGGELTDSKGNREENKEFPDETGDNMICGHKPMRELYTPATPQTDAVFCESCELCGQVLAYGEIPNTAYTAFLEYAACAIHKAQPGEQVVITTDRWISFDGSVLEAVKERADVSILIKYQYQGKEHQVLLPAGVDAGSLEDENGFCGFRYLDQIFGEKIDG